ncbi:type III toxin-antitoxin system TenpIN family toxin [Peptacetobacter hiranonis]|uniref:Type III toxin-antitoxin system ToxN/AbiQ family toxin n=1 Tax=Peptacetobacter hiranonis (strain DSM 13275 / JCM 10541 / KCTC 15199 / TO-931) TaxID=500633 RepID=B6FYH7_PEPHT|nr:hypothetical protein [Peptacetobacter hiranonis]EEA85422.1 hypothetical protein CLOHIR_00929 [Peptacetobacter hiranonis DSM 13275]QEK20230.1 hypothetical protein KGNDJEFE_00712 [Peptacetobacter hiranonis]
MARNKIDFDYQIMLLSDKFFNDYPKDKYPEIILKGKRAFSFFIIETKYDYYIAVPFRSQISHKNAYLFKESRRSKSNKSGIDYSKMIIIRNTEYIDKEAHVDKDEFKEFLDNIDEIVDKSLQYLNGYIKYLSLSDSDKDKRKFERNYRYTSLKYFHKELGLE